MRITWPTVAVVGIVCTFILALYKIGVLTGAGVATSVLAAVVGSLGRPLLTDKSGGTSIIPPAFDVPPVDVPKHDAPKVDQ